MTSILTKPARLAYRLYEAIIGARQHIPASYSNGQTGAEFDAQYGVDTSSDYTTHDIFGTCGDSCPPDAVRESLYELEHHSCKLDPNYPFCSLTCLNYNQFTFVDLGCGKGRAMIVASEFGFDFILGFEINISLSRLANSTSQSVFNRSKVIHAPAEHFNPIRGYGPMVIFLFNPFKTPVLKQVLRNLIAHKKQNPEHPIYVIYEHPVYEKVFKKMDWFELIASTEHSRIYKANP